MSSTYQPNAPSWWERLVGSGYGTLQQGQNYLHDLNPSDYNNRLRDSADEAFAQDRNNLDQANGQYLAQQQGAYNTLAAMAAGNGPSLARANLNAGLQNAFNQSNALSMANTGNIGAGLSQRNLLNAQAGLQSQALTAGAQASAAEQMAAIGQQQSAAQALTGAKANIAAQYGDLAAAKFNQGQAEVQNRYSRDQLQNQIDQQRLAQFAIANGAGPQQTANTLNAAGKAIDTVGAGIKLATGGK